MKMLRYPATYSRFMNYLYYTTFLPFCKYIYQVVEKTHFFNYNFLVWETIDLNVKRGRYETYYTFGF